MAEREETVWSQLATRIPKSLHRNLKLHCVMAGISVMQFVGEAIAEKLEKPTSGTARASRRRGLFR
jgi:predicted HicB family RNase H-like nuclease